MTLFEFKLIVEAVMAMMIDEEIEAIDDDGFDSFLEGIWSRLVMNSVDGIHLSEKDLHRMTGKPISFYVEISEGLKDANNALYRGFTG